MCMAISNLQRDREYTCKDVPGRVWELQQMLDVKLVDPKQEPNIRCAMEVYRKGPLPGGTGPFTMFQDGKVITIRQLHRSSPFWLELRIAAIL
ncbi:hypothetical protein PHISCL_03144 [Aspergillus sclerotialis]|uniref:Uncharacterized protein n=1 Tax=Aspergillus sclerotialis TaxID=2070753 RepID=A0A3A2ZNA1_9EURO|nr:hypothetical protein PHISCL_03144 [Aspergillus sclerotialis]